MKLIKKAVALATLSLLQSAQGADLTCGTFAPFNCITNITGIETNSESFNADLTGTAPSAFSQLRQPIHPAQVKLLRNNMESWWARWKMMSQAKKTIDTTYFIVESDEFGMAFLGLLQRKIRHDGVKVRFLVDARGTKELPRLLLEKDYLQELHEAAKNYNRWAKANGKPESAGIEIKVYNPLYSAIASAITSMASESGVSFTNIAKKVISSNHDKIIIVDDEISITGGRNITRNYFLNEVDHATNYHDTDVVIKSRPIALLMKKAFEVEFKRADINHRIDPEFLGDWVPQSIPLEAAYYAMDTRINGKSLPSYDLLEQQYGLEWTEAVIEKYNTLVKYVQMPCIYERMVWTPSGKLRKACFNDFDIFEGSIDSKSVSVWDKTSALGNANDITPNLISMIKNSEKEILIQNPYVIFTDQIWSALKQVCEQKNIPILLHTNSPQSTDSLFTQLWFIYDWRKKLGENKCLRIMAFEGERKLHTKVFIFDRTITVVGTYNLDPISQNFSSEIVAAINDKEFAKQASAQIIFEDILAKRAKTREYKIQRDRFSKPILDHEGMPKAVPGNSPLEVIQGTSKEKIYKFMELLTKSEYLRQFS